MENRKYTSDSYRRNIAMGKFKLKISYNDGTSEIVRFISKEVRRQQARYIKSNYNNVKKVEDA
jgi:hypothetical protein